MHAQDRSNWRQLVEMAMLTDGALLDDDDTRQSSPRKGLLCMTDLGSCRQS